MIINKEININNSKTESLQKIVFKIFKMLENQKKIISSYHFRKKTKENWNNLYVGNGVFLPHFKGREIDKNIVIIANLKNSIGDVNRIITILLRDDIDKKDFYIVKQIIKSIDRN